MLVHSNASGPHRKLLPPEGLAGRSAVCSEPMRLTSTPPGDGSGVRWPTLPMRLQIHGMAIPRRTTQEPAHRVPEVIKDQIDRRH